MNLKELVDKAHAMSRSKGWYDGENAVRNVPEMLALIHSEVSEALEDYRKAETMELNAMQFESDGRSFDRQKTVQELTDEVTEFGSAVLRKPVGFPSEIADIVIRIGDLCGYLGIDLERAVMEKMAYNDTRPHRHGGKRA